MSWTLIGDSNPTFNWTWVIELIVCILLTIWYLFYFNRFFATLVSYGIRAYTWHKFRIWIDIQSIQISFLAGRLFFKGVRYHGENETILVQNGYLTWRYWLRSTRQLDLTRYREAASDAQTKGDGTTSIPELGRSEDNDEEIGRVKKTSNSDARLAITVSGLEWFLYNRTPAYNSIFPEDVATEIDHVNQWDAKKVKELAAEVTSHIKFRGHSSKTDLPSTASSEGSSTSKKDEAERESRPTTAQSRSTLAREETRSTASELGLDGAQVTNMHTLMLSFMPLAIECSRGAISLGNENTRALIVTTFDKARGHIDASSAEDRDIYRQMFDFEIDHPVVQMKPNPDFRRSQYVAAERIIQALDTAEERRRWWQVNLHIGRRKRKLMQQLHMLLPNARGSVESFHAPSFVEKNSEPYAEFTTQTAGSSAWHGLDRYLDEADRDDHEGWSHIDYARFSTILDSPAIHLNFYWDVPGRVTEDDVVRSRHSSFSDINGASPPAYGMDLIIKGGDVNYGPWADRLRLEIQSAFFPNPYKSVSAAENLHPGDWRQYTAMAIRVDIEEDVSLRIPTRERSKDWQWRGRADAVREAAIQRKQRGKRHFRFRKSPKKTMGSDVRPFGWLAVSVGGNSTVKYEMDMFPRHDGYHNGLELELKDARATSSVNHALLWRCPLHKIRCDLSNPLVWNTLHNWSFNVQSDELEMFLLRDHMFLLTDLISDFTAGNKSEYMTFVPYRYHMALTFNHLKLYLNSNDFNIVDNPTDIEENAYLVLGFESLIGAVDIPMKYFSPRQSRVLFHADGHNASLSLITPTWNTLHTFLEDESMATLKTLGLDGSYNYYSAIASDHTDSLFLTITGISPRCYLHGFLIRHFMNVKENYFGDHLHFKTLEEYQDILENRNGDAAMRIRPPAKKENDLDVILTVRAEHILVLIPANIYSRDDCIRADVLLVEADMRFTNYYMDLQVNTSPVEIATEVLAQVGKVPDVTSCQLFIESVAVIGHRLFGAPPTEPTYVCNWDFDVGFISGECSSQFVKILIQSIQAFIFTFDDFENALPEILSNPLHDVTFLRARAAGLRVWARSEEAAFLLELDPTEVGFNDVAGSKFAKNVHATVPRLAVAAVELKSATRQHENADGFVKTFASLVTSVRVSTLDKSASLSHTRALQQRHIRYHDQRTHRTEWLLHKRVSPRNPRPTPEWAREPPAMPVPSMPEPMSISDIPEDVQITHRGLRRSSSFLSTASPSKRNNVGSLTIPKAGMAIEQTSKASTSKLDRIRRERVPGSFMHESIDEVDNRGGDANNSKSSLQPALLTFSSPWAAPHFALEDVRPDVRDLPELKHYSPKTHKHLGLKLAADDQPHIEDADGVTHLGILCVLENGIVGFCTPDLFEAIAGIMRELQPTSANDRLDGMEQDVISQVTKRLNPKKSSRTLDFAIRIPFAHIKLNNIDDRVSGVSDTFNDQYDFRLVKGHADCRFLTGQSGETELPSVSERVLVYVAVKELSVWATDQALAGGKPAAASATLSDLGVWLSSQDIVAGSLQLNNLVVEFGGAKVEQMAKLLHRSGVMIDRITQVFSNLGDDFGRRHLVYHLTQTSSTATDPVFLTRPSYVLRSAESHVRLSDSWKILSRLRYNYSSATSTIPKETFDECPCRSVDLSVGAKEQMISSFEQWRGWDNFMDQKIPIIEVIFGGSPKLEEQPSRFKPVRFEVIVGQLALILDPGLHQSDLTLVGIDTNIALAHSDGESPEQSADRKRLTIQSYVAKMALNLNWELVELASSLLEIVHTASDSTDKGEPLVKIPTAQSKQSLEVEFVIGADLASIAVTSVNLQLKLGAESLRSSLLHLLDEDKRQYSIFTISSRTAMAKLDALEGGLLGWKLTAPKIYGSVISPLPKADSLTLLRLGAACDRLRFNLKQDIPGLLQVARQVIDSEFREIVRLIPALPLKEKDDVSLSAARSSKSNLELHLALFLNDYKLEFALLPALRYAIAGKVARTSIVPRANGRFEVNFDLKQHEHSFRSVWAESYDQPSVLRMPPINGRVAVRGASKSTSVKAHVTVEQIEFEAAAVRACFDVVNQPGFLNAVKSIKSDVEQVQSSLQSIFESDTRSEADNIDKPASVVRFTLEGFIAGVAIHCSAPSRRSQHIHTDLNFKLGATALRVHNAMHGSASVYEKPQFHVNVREIGLDLYRREQSRRSNFGNFSMAIKASGVTEMDGNGNQIQVYGASSDGIKVDMFEETAALVVDVATFLQDRIKSITISDQAKQIRPLRRLTIAGLAERSKIEEQAEPSSDAVESSGLFDSIYSLNIDRIQIRWNLSDKHMLSPGRELEDLVFSIRKIDLETRREGSARLSILDMQLQIVPHSQDPTDRTANSALLPEMIFSAAYLSTKKDRRFAFQAKGKALDLRLAADFVVPASALQKSLANASAELRNVQTNTEPAATVPDSKKTPYNLLGGKRLGSLLVDVDFAGAVVHISARDDQSRSSSFGILKGPARSRAGRYGQVVQGENATEATLQAPGVAFKIEYRDNGSDDPALSTEIKVAASSNTLYPSVVPLVLEISSSIKEILGEGNPASKREDSTSQAATKYLSEAAMTNPDPTAILGKCKLNAGLWIQRQEFSLSCQPIARVSATARFDDIFMTVNTVQSSQQDRFFSVLTTFNKLQASVQHVYSRESTASFEVDSIVMSLMNSKHVSSKTGISAILNVSPMKTDINAKQLQDFLLFREIWYPAELRGPRDAPAPVPTTSDTHAFAIQRYQQIAATGTLPWSAIVSIQELKLQVDFGQGLGKSLFTISKLWASSKKKSDSEQNLCIGFEKVGADSTGRMSGFVELQNFRVRTSIRWPADAAMSHRAPLVQGSIGFNNFRVKAAFDYQHFAVADISTFEFLIYNVRQPTGIQKDRLVGILNGGKVQAFVTTAAAAQGFALFQAFERLVQEKDEAYESALRELDRYLRRKSVFPSSTWNAPDEDEDENGGEKSLSKAGFSLHTDVVVTLQAVDVGVFPNTFFDNQILKVDATDAQARFAVSASGGRIHSGLGMTLGQVRVALSNVNRANTKALGEVSVSEVIERATSSKGGTILRVPRLVSSMQTWQTEETNVIEYIFRSTFEGKVDVGWNYSRISFIRGMWQTHSRALAQRMGKPLPPSALKITAEPQGEGPSGGQEKITAVVHMPTSKYKYVALEPPIIDTPQLRDMGEATPPLEWIGLHRDKLPEATHSVAIVTLLEVAKEVEDAYTRILGSS